MVASVNDDLYTPFPRVLTDEGFQSSEEGSELHSPVFDQPFNHFSPAARYHSTSAVHQLPTLATNVIPSAFDHHHHHSWPAEQYNYVNGGPQIIESLKLPATALNIYNSDLRVPSFTTSAVSLGSPPRLAPEDTTYEDYTVSIDASSHIPMSHSSTTRASALSLTTADEPQASSSGMASTEASTSRASRAQRKDASNIVIACRQCRARKIRCDSTRPECNNCSRRSNECVYDAAPKRRGPDKRPGTRQRSCKKRPADGSAPVPKKKRRTDPADEHHALHAQHTPPSPNLKPPPGARQIDIKPEPDLGPFRIPEEHQPSYTDGYFGKRRSSPSYRRSAMNSALLSDGESNPFDFDLRSPASFSDDAGHNAGVGSGIPHPPSLAAPSPILPVPPTEYGRKAWWDAFLTTYAPTREHSFSQSGYWFTFIDGSEFLRTLYDPVARAAWTPPAFVLAALALATLMQSSEAERGAAGRIRALWLRDAAQAALETAWAAHAVDLGLAEAAFVLALFEASAHPQHTPARAEAALTFLDSIIRVQHLTLLDAHDPAATSGAHPLSASSPTQRKTCNCTNAPRGSQDGLTLAFVPAWDPTWTRAERDAEETRRLCWSALMLVADHTVACSALRRPPLDLFLGDSTNFKLLFPGEYGAGPGGAKDTVWALYCRSMLIWNMCSRFEDPSLSGDAKAQIAVGVFVETNTMDRALDAHVCNIDTSLIYMSRELISNTRLAVTYLMRRMLLDLDSKARPVWNRRLAEEWLFYQEQVARKVKASIQGLREASGHMFLRRPALISWFTSQVAMCLSIWSGDNSLMRALELAKSFLIPLEVLNILWPCPVFQAQCTDLRNQLEDACAISSIPPPLLQQFSLPPAILQL
ncbi:hypothetical protein EVG20_g4654 [Dentipellis fragilis]|uniref:Zn(2)-C6 fungal-type domain-containing protein n=1 Tax=Dentipellis fragilis TaxID=205917 RepID=A0A4Y9YW38_9AGAM|nr:hypothetical protein EVG20_g4654 [Dentipellis fragilis]